MTTQGGSDWDPNALEVKSARVHCLLGALKGKEYSAKDWRGFLEKTYNNGCSKKAYEKSAAKLRRKLKRMEGALTQDMSFWLAKDNIGQEYLADIAAKAARDEETLKGAEAKLSREEITLINRKYYDFIGRIE